MSSMAAWPTGLRTNFLDAGEPATPFPPVLNRSDDALRKIAAVAGRQRFVSPTGSDTNDGGFAYPFLTLQKAYDDLGSATPNSSGKIWVYPGVYDGQLALDRRKMVIVEAIAGMPQKSSGHTEDAGAARILSTTGHAKLVHTDNPVGTNVVGFGFSFKGIQFQAVHASTLIGIECKSNMLIVEDCGFAADPAIGAHDGFVGIKTDVVAGTAEDASWSRIVRNYARDCALCQLGENPVQGSENSNQHYVVGNFCYGRGPAATGAKPAIWLNNNNRSYTAGNNLEQYAVGERWDSCWQCTSVGNGGEAVTTFWDGHGVFDSVISPRGISVVVAQTLVKGDATTVRNVFTLPAVGGVYPDNTTTVDLASDQNTVIIGGQYRLGATLKVLAGTGTPEGAVAAPVGSLFLRRDGGATTTLYVKTSGTGNTGWTAK